MGETKKNAKALISSFLCWLCAKASPYQLYGCVGEASFYVQAESCEYKWSKIYLSSLFCGY
jgi:hypothetical protein